jgi:acyl-CoA synthetase (AMP-forming)/AMP-acid ligase II/acyl carrier protein
MIEKTSDQVQDLVELLEWRDRHQPQLAAFGFLDRDLEIAERDAYGTLAAWARTIAAYLRANGVGQEPVVLAYPPGLSLVRGLWGILYAGAIAVPAYPPVNKRSAGLVEHILRGSGARFVLADAASAEAYRAAGAELGREIVWLNGENLAMNAAADFEPSLPGAEAPAILQYTSGSVENPKGVVLTHRNILANSRLIYRSFFHTSRSRGLIWLPPYHDMGLIGGIVQPVFAGFYTNLMSPRTFLRDPLNWLKALQMTRATTSGGPNFAYERCLQIPTEKLKEAKIDLSTWQVAFNGAEPIAPSTLRAFIAKYAPFGFEARRFMACYGLAESTLYVASSHKLRKPNYVAVESESLRRNEVRLREEGSAGSQLLTSHGTVGPNIKIVNSDTLKLARPYEVGEIWVTGESVASRYWGREQESREVFHARMENDDSEYLRTGDLGFIHRGELYVTGRRKDLIVIAGRNHYPHDIETTVQNAHEALELGAGAAFSVPSGPGGRERLVVVQEVARDHESGLDAAPVLEAARVAVFERHGISIAELALAPHGSVPRTRSGKVRRNACREMYAADQLRVLARWRMADDDDARTAEAEHPLPESAPHAPSLAGLSREEASTALLAWMRQRVAYELRIPESELDPNMHFGLYGLDSLIAVTMTSLLSQALGMELEETLLWDYPNFNLLGGYLIDRFFSAHDPQ